MAERLLHWYGSIHGFSWAALRYFNVEADRTIPFGRWWRWWNGRFHVPDKKVVDGHERRNKLLFADLVKTETDQFF